MCSQSKPWWNPNLTKAFKAMRTAREMVKSYYQHFNHQSKVMELEVHKSCKRALCLIKSAKHEHYLKLMEGADAQSMWSFHKWTMGKHTYTSLVLSRGDGEEPAVSHSDKCSLLRTTLFPPQLQLTNEPPINLEPRSNDMTYHKGTKQEEHDALFSAPQINAPDITIMPVKSYS